MKIALKNLEVLDGLKVPPLPPRMELNPAGLKINYLRGPDSLNRFKHNSRFGERSEVLKCGLNFMPDCALQWADCYEGLKSVAL
jgi:hypothetical protein